MKFNPALHHRKSIRLRGWNYAWSGWYFVTIVTKDRRCDLGSVRDGEMILTDLGKAAEECWVKIPQHHAGVRLDAFVIMPNHVHGIVVIDESVRRDVQLNVPTRNNLDPSFPTHPLYATRPEAMGALSPNKGTLSVVIRTFKAAVTTWARWNGHADFAWQSRFHDRIIRSNEDLERIRWYIKNNPRSWNADEEDPEGS